MHFRPEALGDQNPRVRSKLWISKSEFSESEVALLEEHKHVVKIIRKKVFIVLRPGKWYEYHSRILIEKVLTSLSSWSKRAMLWMIMLSDLFTLNLTLARE